MIVIEEEKVRHMNDSMFRADRAAKDIEWNDAIEEVMNQFPALPTIDTDMSEYSDRLWKLAYERGKAEGIVRCKDCIWRLGTDCTRFAEIPVSLDDYCSRAERKRSR